MSSPSCCRAPMQPVRAAPPNGLVPRSAFAGRHGIGRRGHVPGRRVTAADVAAGRRPGLFPRQARGRDRVATAAEASPSPPSSSPRRRPRSTRGRGRELGVFELATTTCRVAANGDHAPMTQRLATQQLGWLAALGIAIVVLGGGVSRSVPASPRGSARPSAMSATAPAAAPSPSPSGPSTRPSFIYPTPTPLPTFLVYEVRSGDTLTSIARTHGTTPRSIAFWNRERYPSLDPDSPTYSPNRIDVGWELLLVPDVEVDPEELPEPSTAPSRRVRPRPRADDSAARGLNRRRARPGTGTRTAST